MPRVAEAREAAPRGALEPWELPRSRAEGGVPEGFRRGKRRPGRSPPALQGPGHRLRPGIFSRFNQHQAEGGVCKTECLSRGIWYLRDGSALVATEPYIYVQVFLPPNKLFTSRKPPCLFVCLFRRRSHEGIQSPLLCPTARLRARLPVAPGRAGVVSMAAGECGPAERAFWETWRL